MYIILMDTIDKLVQFHLNGNSDNELEVRFGTTSNYFNITEIMFDNVIRYLKSNGYKSDNENGISILKIQNSSNIRVEMTGGDIQNYCNNNIIDDTSQQTIFNIKEPVQYNGRNIKPIDFKDFNFRVSYSYEKNIERPDNVNWDRGNLYRYMKRITFRHDSMPLRIDLSIVKTNKTDKHGKTILSNNFKTSGVIDSNLTYEIEIEVEKSDIDYKSLTASIKNATKHILSGLQESNYPVSYKEIEDVRISYYNLINNTSGIKAAINRDFCGPSSFTLELKNIQPVHINNTTPNILENYTVTDKADGVRKLLYINDNGRVYLIDMNMNVQFTGTIVASNFNSLLDGEHIIHNKLGDFINLYMAFDIYYIDNTTVRNRLFIPSKDSDDKDNFRLPKLISFVDNMKKEIKSITGSKLHFNVDHKNFYSGNDIFNSCKTIFAKPYLYETDGIIFTPANLAVGADITDPFTPSLPVKRTWEHSFKWKPPDFNTIDFLVRVKKNESGEDYIGNIFASGTNMQKTKQITQYKVITLMCGFDTKKHGYLNPCSDIINGNYDLREKYINYNTYKPMPFYPTSPYDPETHLCNIILKDDKFEKKQMFSENGEKFNDNMIVEFRYDIKEKKGFKWKPLRVRFDKTAEYKSGIKNYGNAYHVANSNWHSIHNPVTSAMLTGVDDIPVNENTDDVYYNRINKNVKTKGLRDFHNLIVKKRLISIASEGDTLIDLSVGKGGDIPKWISLELSFVFGIDISNDNIENRIDGACARYLNYRAKSKIIPDAVFLNGNSSLNIRDGSAFNTIGSRNISDFIFGKTNKSPGDGIKKLYSVGKPGFDITSCQFSVHYFFENRETFEGFLRNVSQCTKIGGYFIGCCYDGKKMFDLLNSSKKFVVKDDKHILCEISKEYSQETFPDDISSLGYPIRVYQDTINKYFVEYLVNFTFFIKCLELYGFETITTEESQRLGFPSSVGSFKDIYNYAKEDKTFKGQDMTKPEKTISFINNYFIFKKKKNVDTTSINISNDSTINIKSKIKKTKKKFKVINP